MLRRPVPAFRAPGRRLLAALVPAVALAGLAMSGDGRTGALPSPAEAGPLTVATWNMCGVLRWNCAGTGDSDAKREQMERLATRFKAQVMLLQEACAADVEAVRDALGPSWHSAFQPYTRRDSEGQRSTVRCGASGRGDAGYALLSAYPLTDVRRVSSPQPDTGVQRGILCAFVAAYDVTVCTAHLTPHVGEGTPAQRDFRRDQLAALADAVPERRTVYGGDLNVDPPGEHNPDSWVWPEWPYGTHWECDEGSARATHESRHKLDYLFTDLPRTGCRVIDTGVSDHRALVIQVDSRVG
ncbi:endonuclease/exonuclease/phosphatase family protein [Streptomyces sp. AC04842]|uniref:endonuclease/exonuclease/phosphatase family protein n=1 Tax=Streptomyces sp. AC04842 TaxID=2775327 RepID=UPI0020C7224A|nr:endonuclease/exonuclease/phosphatase family protein [Streptomyces sp. AC04842]